ncbi:unnamed protein product [Phytophthora lilii]|uniref:Tubulin-specific chaperone A n=1 Tax=Phytophthora lilii TaxID=2077276 RepID=A0A9W6TT69_9STRA|nr:unnamed protein product [Phytophthora lilii]
MKFLIPTAIALAASGSIVNAAEFCGTDSNSNVNAGAYTAYNNIWGEDKVSATQCTEVDSAEGNTIAWYTRYNATGGDPSLYKSFAAAALQFSKAQLSSIKCIPTTINYNYTSDGELVSNVTYDMFTSWTPGARPHFELMVWLAAGVEFDLYAGWHQSHQVFTYVAKQPVTSFNGDLKSFFDAMPYDYSIPDTQYLSVLLAGTQAFQGTNSKLTYYAKEHQTQQAKIEQMRADGRDEHVVRKQEEVLVETETMLPDCQGRLREAAADISSFIDAHREEVEPLESFQEAQELLAAVPALL